MNKKEWDKISNKYYKNILSPIKNSKNNPLLHDLRKIKNKKSKSIIDLGCGLGDIELILSKYFKKVVAIDFSKKMLEIAMRKNKNLKNVTFVLKDFKDLKSFTNQLDVAISINALVSPNIALLDSVLKEICNILKKSGTFIAILPSMEVYTYEAMLLYGKKGKKNLDKLFDNKEYDFLLGITNFEGKQKAWYSFEILWRFKKAGFKNIEIKKVNYSWKEFQKAGQEYLPGNPLPWDWYVICKKA